MRYLYGDSANFPLQYNFLQTLDAFLTSAARAVELEAQARHMHVQANEAATVRMRNVEGLERFHQVVMRALRDSSSRSMEGLMVDYARQLADHAGRIVDTARGQMQSANDSDLGQIRGENDRRRAEIRAATEAFFRVSRLPIVEARVAMSMPVARDPQHEMSAVITFAENIVVGYTLQADAVAEWRHPRRVAEFAQGVNLMIGSKKSWFKKTGQPEQVLLDDYYLSGFDLSDDSAQIWLRRRPDQPDSYHFFIRRIDMNLHAEVRYPDIPEAGASPVEPSDKGHLERLWQIIRAAAMPVLEFKTRVVSIHLDGEEVFEGEKVAALIQRIVKLLAPTVAEITRRSPNAQELSLKIEHEGGRREEIYLKRVDLVAKLAPLGPQERAIFAALALGPAEPSVIAPSD
jgi:hypothetical protein